MTIREFFRTVWAGKYYVLAAVLVVAAGALLYLTQQQTQYRATATVHLNGVQSVQGGEQLVQVTVETDPDDVTSPEVAEVAAGALGEPGQAEALATEVSASFDGEASAMVVEATTTDPARSVEVANAFAEAYAARLVPIQAAQVEVLDARRQALAEQLRAVRQRLAVDTDDPLALAEQDIIVADYSALTVEINALRGIAVPGEVVAPATSAETVGLSAPTVLALAVLVGLVAGVGLAFGRRGLDVRVRSAAESTHLTDTPVLAELYGARPAEKEFAHTLALPVASKVASPFTESIRELRTAVQVSTAGLKHAVVVVTAADPSTPRAFITANLAASFALSGRRTVALSGDLRRPQLDTLLPAPESWRGDEHELRPTTVPNLRVMPVPEEEMDPADFLATSRARQLVRSLREHAEVVVVDAPPVLAAADATILGGYSNGVVLIAAAGRTDRAVLVAATERLRVSNVPLLGIALTGVKGDRRMLYASTYGEGHASAEERTVDERTEGERTGQEHVAHERAGQERAGQERAGHEPAAQQPAEPAPGDLAPVEQGPGEHGAGEHEGAKGGDRPAGGAVPSEPSEDRASSRERAATRRASVAAASVPVERAASADGAAGRRAVLSPTWSKVEAAAPDEEDSADAAATSRKRPFRW
jgi:tyrosine-protein kinase Etk/Wzc